MVSSTQAKSLPYSHEVVAIEIPKVFTAFDIFYPKERGYYEYEGLKFFGLQERFKAQNPDALFYGINITNESGIKGLAIHSQFVHETESFLMQNGMPIRGLHSDCQFYHTVLFAHYYTTDPAICAKLATILIEINQFDLSEDVLKRMFNFERL